MNSNGHATKRAAERAVGEAENLFDRMIEKSEYAEEELKRYAKTADNYIQKHPVRSAIVAGVIGLILGKVLR